MPARRRKVGQKPALGQYLEWHRTKIRVRVRVPPSMMPVLGVMYLRKSLNTDDPRLAEVLKHRVVQELKATIYRAQHGSKDDPLIREALEWRTGLEEAKRLPDPASDHEQPAHVTLQLAADQVADGIREREGDDRADLFLGVALGKETPLSLYVDDWITTKEFAPRTEASMRQAVAKLEAWCKATKAAPAVLEAINAKIAAQYVEEVFERPRVASATANKLISGLSSCWKWLRRSRRLDPDHYANPWLETRVAREKAHRVEHDVDKRPFTNEEVATLLQGIRVQPVCDMMWVSLATGMRLTEIANLKAGHVAGDMIRVRVAKTPAGRREFPMPDVVKGIMARRIEGKQEDGYLFDDLPKQEGGKRGRGAPASQAFTRERRKLAVDDVPPGTTQSRVDFHSCRRWFIRKAGDALVDGATGFTPWTIADVVGHDTKSDGPLPLTMGLYPGKADLKAMRACLDAVKLPVHGSAETGARRSRGRPKARQDG